MSLAIVERCLYSKISCICLFIKALLFLPVFFKRIISATAKVEILLQKAIERLDIKEDFYNLVFIKVYKPLKDRFTFRSAYSFYFITVANWNKFQYKSYSSPLCLDVYRTMMNYKYCAPRNPN